MAASYKCTSVGCYSVNSPDTNTLFQQLQTRVNQFAASAGIDPIGVDGIIGKGTTQAALVVLEMLIDAANANPMNTSSGAILTSATALDAAINGPEDLAGLAQDVTNTLTLAASSQLVGTMPPAPLPAPTPAPSAIQVATTSANKPASAKTQAAQLKLTSIGSKSGLATSLLDVLPPWASYVGGAALAIGAIVAVVKMKRGRQSTPAVAGYRRRHY
jgi:hypothetical protein